MTGRPVIPPRFVEPAPGSAYLVVRGADGADPRAVRVVVERDGVEVADLSNVLVNVGVTTDANDLARIDFEGYIAPCALPENARRVFVAADGTFDVDLHTCPHVTMFGQTECGWCGESIVDDDLDIRVTGEDVESVPVYCGGTFHGHECQAEYGHDGPHVFHIEGTA